jgi:hypothetical protein
MDCNSVCEGIKQFIGNTAINILAVLIVGSIIVGVFKSLSNWAGYRRAKAGAKLEKKIRQLFAEIAELPSPRLSTEGVPHRFPSKEAAQAFGERWSRGGKDSFTARSVDVTGFDELHPRFNPSAIAGGILYSYPALFFGMQQAYRDGDKWFLDFTRAKKEWLENYRNQLKRGVPAY